jgi:Recombination endonuclease VII.
VYGLKPGEYGKLYLTQGGTCAICRRATGATRALAVDHDHKTGLVRGLLCSPCNKLLGHLRDDVELARGIVTYLLEPTARRLGIEALHEDFRKEQE